MKPYFYSETLSLETQEMLGVSGNGVLVKVEPQASLGQPRQYQPSVKGSGFFLNLAYRIYRNIFSDNNRDFDSYF